MSILAQIVIAGLIFVAGTATGIRWHAGQDALQEIAARELRDSDARQQRMFHDRKAGLHAADLARLSNQLGDARAQISRLPGRSCLDADTVRLLNDTGNLDDSRAAAGEPASPPAPAASAAGQPGGAEASSASDIDVAGYIATCRTRYAEVAGQLNQILDIEDRRHPPAPP